MTETSEFHEAQSRHVRNGQTCLVVRVRGHLAGDPKRQEALDKALDDPFITGTVIASVLSGWGYSLSPNAVRRHRRRECQCL